MQRTNRLLNLYQKNVKDILIPSEEHRIPVYPMDYEEFLWAVGQNPDILEQAYRCKAPLGAGINRKAMRDFRIYMAVGGMPQAVETYINTNNFERVDRVKREIIELYHKDLKKIDPSGRLSDIYQSVPAQLAQKKKRFIITAATGKQKTHKDEERIYELVESGLVLPCYHVDNPGVFLAQTKNKNQFKLYLSDTGLFKTILFSDSENGREEMRPHRQSKPSAVICIITHGEKRTAPITMKSISF